MQELICSYVIQKGECTLPHIGILQREIVPAKLDIANKQIVPPSTNVTFTENHSANSPELPYYVSSKKNITVYEAQQKVDEYCQEIKNKINSGERVELGIIGWFQKDSHGKIDFEPSSLNTGYPVSAERVLHQDVSHNMLVGDRETTSDVMNKYYRGAVVFERSHWSTWAMILAAIALSVLFFHFRTHKINVHGIGNQQQFKIAVPPVTHVEYKPK